MDCAGQYQKMSSQERESWMLYALYVALREYCLARGRFDDAASLRSAYETSLVAMRDWLSAHPDAKAFAVEASSAISLVDDQGNLDQRFLVPGTCRLSWSTVACYYYGVAGTDGKVLALAKSGDLSWMDSVDCPDRIKNEPGPRQTGWPVLLKIGFAAGILGVSWWMFRSVTR